MDNPIPSTSSSTPGSTETPSGSTPQTADDLDDDDRAALAIHVAKINAGAGGAGAGGAGTGSASSTGDDMAKSVKCSDCGKVFRNASLVSFHAEKSVGNPIPNHSLLRFVPWGFAWLVHGERFLSRMTTRDAMLAVTYGFSSLSQGHSKYVVRICLDLTGNRLMDPRFLASKNLRKR